MYFTKRTDLAAETKLKSPVSEFELYGMKIISATINKDEEEITEKSAGHYYTIELSEIPDNVRESHAVAAVLRRLLPKGKCLAVGLGNPEISSDSLGWKTAEKILATSHFIRGGMRLSGMGDVSVIRTNVSANSGIDSAVQVKATANAINADYILAVDSLCCKSHSRLCRNIQLCDSGIAPGSGAGNPRQELTARTLGIPVISIGVPTALEYKDRNSLYYVTRRDIDIDIRRFARVISSAVNSILNNGLTEAEIELLRF